MGTRLEGDWTKFTTLLKSNTTALQRDREFKLTMKSMGEVLLASTITRFRKEQSPNGKSWARWSTAYQKLRDSRTGRFPASNKKLVVTGRLRNSITRAVKGLSVLVGTNVKYAAVHQFGSRKRKIPARPFLGFSKRDNLSIQNEILEYFKRKGF